MAFEIVVLDRGFVYVGNVQTDMEPDTLVIMDAKNIRYWGTTRGLGELALNGPTPKTLMDPVGTVHAPLRAVIHRIETDQAKWPR